MSVASVAASVYKWSSGTTFALHPSSAASRLYTSISVNDEAFGVSTAKLTLLNPGGKNKGTWAVGDHIKIVSKSKVLFYGKVDTPQYSSSGNVINIDAADSRGELKRIEVTTENPQVYPTVDNEALTDTVPEVIEWINAYTVHPDLDNYDNSWTFDKVGPPHHLKLTRSTAGTALITLRGISIDRAYSGISGAVDYTWFVDSTSYASVKLYVVPNAPGVYNGSSNASYGFDDFHNVRLFGNAINSCLRWEVWEDDYYSWLNERRINVNTFEVTASEGMRLDNTSRVNIGGNAQGNSAAEAMIFFDKVALQNNDFKHAVCIRVDADFSDFYGVEIGYSDANNFRLVKRIAGDYTVLDGPISVPVETNNEQHIVGLSVRSTAAGVALRGYLDHELKLSATDATSTISGNFIGIFFKSDGSYVEAEVDDIKIYPTITSFTYDIDAGDALDVTGGEDVTTVYNDVTVYGAIAVDGKHVSQAIRDRSPPRPLGTAIDTRSISAYGRHTLETTNLNVKVDHFAIKAAQAIVGRYRKPRVVKTLQLVGATTLPEKFSQLIRIETDNTALGGLYYVRGREWSLNQSGYTVNLNCEEVFLE